MKIVLFGDASVGKTSIRHRYFGRGFKSIYMMTMGADFGIKRLEVENVGKCVLQIWDLAGNPVFSQIRKNYYQGIHGGILVFDLTNASTFESMTTWIRELIFHNEKIVPLIFCGNKVDLIKNGAQRAVPSEQVHKFLAELREEHNMKFPYVETSAKTGDNIEQAFQIIIDEITTKI